MNIFEVMIKSITNFLIIFFIFQQLKSQISQIDQNGYSAFCDETLHMFMVHFSEKVGLEINVKTAWHVAIVQWS